MINFLAKLLSGLFGITRDLVIGLFAMLGGGARVPRLPPPPRLANQLEQADGDSEVATIPAVMSFLEGAGSGATIQEISERLQGDGRNILPLLKGLVREGRVDEILGRYYAVKDDDRPPSES